MALVLEANTELADRKKKAISVSTRIFRPTRNCTKTLNYELKIQALRLELAHLRRIRYGIDKLAIVTLHLAARFLCQRLPGNIFHAVFYKNKPCRLKRRMMPMLHTVWNDDAVTGLGSLYNSIEINFHFTF